MTTWRVWFSAVGASQNPPRPWGVRSPDGALFLAADVVAVAARTAYTEHGFAELPSGPKGILECDYVTLVDARPLVES